MTAAAVSCVAFAAAALAAAWPHVAPSRPEASGDLSPADRAQWVNRLFALAAVADARELGEVATAARALIAALVKRADGK
jgi:hypothetical protein